MLFLNNFALLFNVLKDMPQMRDGMSEPNHSYAMLLSSNMVRIQFCFSSPLHCQVNRILWENDCLFQFAVYFYAVSNYEVILGAATEATLITFPERDIPNFAKKYLLHLLNYILIWELNCHDACQMWYLLNGICSKHHLDNFEKQTTIRNRVN